MLFWRDVRPFVLVYFGNMILVSVVVTLTSDVSISYLWLITGFLFSFTLIVRFLRRRKLYERLTTPPTSLEEAQLPLDDAPLSIAVEQLLHAQFRLLDDQKQQLITKQREQQLFMNHWIHQMKTPLSVLQLYTQQLEGDVRGAMTEELDKLNRGLTLALYYARQQSIVDDFVIQQFGIRELWQEIINEEKRLFIQSGLFPKLDGDEHVITSDRKWLKFAFAQLLYNAVKYSKGRGKFITIRLETIGTRVKVTVHDDGVGIPAADIPRIFEPFFTGENGRVFGESTGMGLAIVAAIFRQFGHTIQVESTDGTDVIMSF